MVTGEKDVDPKDIAPDKFGCFRVSSWTVPSERGVYELKQQQ